MSKAGAHGDPVGTIRREVHPSEILVFKPGHEGPGYTIWVCVEIPDGVAASGRSTWIRVESTNWHYGFGFSSQQQIETHTSVIGVVPGTEADRLNKELLEGLRQLGEDPAKETEEQS